MRYRRLLLTVVAIASPVGACADEGTGGDGTFERPAISVPSLPSATIPTSPPTGADPGTGPGTRGTTATTCPMDPTDADGDGHRSCDYVYDTYAEDGDGDGLVDESDPYPYTRDWDNDGLPDGSDPQISTDQERVQEEWREERRQEARRAEQRQEAERERQRQEQRREEERQRDDVF